MKKINTIVIAVVFSKDVSLVAAAVVVAAIDSSSKRQTATN